MENKPRIRLFAVLLKAAFLFTLFNFAFILIEGVPLGRLTLYNTVFPGRERFPFGEARESYNLSLFDLDAMFTSHILISDQIQTIDKYSRIAAEDLLKTGEKFSLFKLFFHPPFRFIKEYLFKSGFRDGLPGLIIAVATMFYVFIKYAKFWELTALSKKEKKDSSQ